MGVAGAHASSGGSGVVMVGDVMRAGAMRLDAIRGLVSGLLLEIRGGGHDGIGVRCEREMYI